MPWVFLGGLVSDMSVNDVVFVAAAAASGSSVVGVSRDTMFNFFSTEILE